VEIGERETETERLEPPDRHTEKRGGEGEQGIKREQERGRRSEH